MADTAPETPASPESASAEPAAPETPAATEAPAPEAAAPEPVAVALAEEAPAKPGTLVDTLQGAVQLLVEDPYSAALLSVLLRALSQAKEGGDLDPSARMQLKAAIQASRHNSQLPDKARAALESLAPLV